LFPERTCDFRCPSTPLAALLAALSTAACVRQHCYDDADCPAAKTCSSAGTCIVPECDVDRPCPSGFVCVAKGCQPEPPIPITCPEDMVIVAGTFCADKYEASRPDATLTSSGRDGARAMSLAGVMPWMVADNAAAELACGAAGKRLCTPEEWRIACKGPDGTVYAYGDSYDPLICNGIDTFGRQSFHLMPTGSFPACTNEWGLFDINGNLWEHVAGGSDMTVRGGAFNCNDSRSLHKCDYVPDVWTPSARGFRCCLTPPGGLGAFDGGVLDPSASTDAAGDGAGCIANGDVGSAEVTAFAAEVDGNTDAQDGADDPDGQPADVPMAYAGTVEAAETEPGMDGTDEAGASAPCPPDMALIGAVCVDRHEASRQDATATSAGTDESVAASRPGVLPWYVNPMSAEALAKFQAACAASGKRLCGAEAWLAACQGPDRTRYVFGNDWDPSVCNSVDTHCQECCDILGLASCPTGENCGYASDLTSSYTPETCFISEEYGRDTCHVCFHVMATGALSTCTSSNGLFDVNGNVWEIVAVPTSEDGRGYQVRGGAFNCGSPSWRFDCGFNATWSDLYAGFRCCRDPITPSR
jgi:sulfatase modifying factor 1